jgi:malate synthase
VFTADVQAALNALAPLDADRKAVMAGRIARRRSRSEKKQRIAFLDPQSLIPRTKITCRTRATAVSPAARSRPTCGANGFRDRPAARAHAVESGIRNVAYALLSGADGGCSRRDALGRCRRCR